MSDQFDSFSIHLSEDDDGDFLAHFIELPNVSAFASTPEAALHELKQAWEGVKASYRKHNEPIPIAPTKKEYWSSPDFVDTVTRPFYIDSQTPLVLPSQ